MVEVPPLSFRAAITSFNEEARTIELIFSTGAPVQRYDWSTGKRYLEQLSMDPKAVRLTRLNEAGPLLDAHNGWSVRDQLGAVVEGLARIDKGKGLATVRFSSRDDVTPILQDVREKIIRSVSVGYNVHKYEEEVGNGNKLPIRTATDWEPFEVSFVPMPADIGAKARREEIATNSCVIVRAYSDEDRMRRFRFALATSRVA